MTNVAGERREVELTAPPAAEAAASWPEPVCPGALLNTFAGKGLEEPSAPGESPLDDGLERLREGLRPQEGDPS
jgi:hypothetical protein